VCVREREREREKRERNAAGKTEGKRNVGGRLGRLGHHCT